MVVWAHEEGFAFGRGIACSRIVAGLVDKSDMSAVWNGMTRADAIRRVGGDPDRILEARRPKGAHHCYLELHIEQGGTLERANTAIGVVEGIVAIVRYEAVITGFANHAGTTPMAADAATATPDVQSAIERASDSLGLNHSRLPSGAGHDAQNMALIGPMGMIFVPSVGGVSHSPKELTHWDDCTHGADVLLRTVLEVDRL